MSEPPPTCFTITQKLVHGLAPGPAPRVMFDEVHKGFPGALLEHHRELLWETGQRSGDVQLRNRREMLVKLTGDSIIPLHTGDHELSMRFSRFFQPILLDVGVELALRSRDAHLLQERIGSVDIGRHLHIDGGLPIKDTRLFQARDDDFELGNIVGCHKDLVGKEFKK